jgi:hypothetical protein
LKPRRIILFRFDRNPLVCRSRVALLRRLNPGVPLFGVLGAERGFRHFGFRLGSKRFLRLDGFYWSRERGRWNWKHGDLVFAAWYRDVGYRIEFDIAHVIEWDLLLLEPLERLYESVPEGAVGLTALTPLSAIEHDWDWMQRTDDRRQWEELLAYARETWDYDQVPYACWGPGSCLPRSFLERYAAIDAPVLAHDELRLPLFGQMLGFPLVDTRFRLSWGDSREDRFFNLASVEIEQEVIMRELAKPDGRRAFHPVRHVWEVGAQTVAPAASIGHAATQ